MYSIDKRCHTAPSNKSKDLLNIGLPPHSQSVTQPQDSFVDWTGRVVSGGKKHQSGD